MEVHDWLTRGKKKIKQVGGKSTHSSLFDIHAVAGFRDDENLTGKGF